MQNKIKLSRRHIERLPIVLPFTIMYSDKLDEEKGRWAQFNKKVQSNCLAIQSLPKKQTSKHYIQANHTELTNDRESSVEYLGLIPLFNSKRTVFFFKYNFFAISHNGKCCFFLIFIKKDLYSIGVVNWVLSMMSKLHHYFFCQEVSYALLACLIWFIGGWWKQ